MKKAQGLPLNTIIIAILALIVLVFLVLIFTGKINLFSKSINSCEGYCNPTANCGEDLGYYLNPCKDGSGAEASSERTYCCPSR